MKTVRSCSALPRHAVVFGVWQLVWYDADRDVSYSLTIFGADAVAQTGFSGQNAAGHVSPAKALAAFASQFIGI